MNSRVHMHRKVSGLGKWCHCSIMSSFERKGARCRGFAHKKLGENGENVNFNGKGYGKCENPKIKKNWKFRKLKTLFWINLETARKNSRSSNCWLHSGIEKPLVILTTYLKSVAALESGFIRTDWQGMMGGCAQHFANFVLFRIGAKGSKTQGGGGGGSGEMKWEWRKKRKKGSKKECNNLHWDQHSFRSGVMIRPRPLCKQLLKGRIPTGGECIEYLGSFCICSIDDCVCVC